MHVIDFVILAGWAIFWIYWLAASVGVTTDPCLQGIGLVVFVLGLALAVWARSASAGTGECQCPRRSTRNS